MEDRSDQRLYRIIRTVVRAFLSTYPQRRIGVHDEQDLTHTIFVKFVDNDRAQMAKFKPHRGSFAGWVAMKTRFWLRTIARKYRDRDGLAQFEALGDQELEDIGQRDLADATDKRLRLLAVAECTKARHPDPMDQRAVHLMFEALATDEEFMAALNIERPAMYRIKHRLRRTAWQCLEKLYPEETDE